MLNVEQGIVQWLEHQTCDRKVLGSSPCRSGGRIFFSVVNFLCWVLFQYLFYPHVTAVASKRSQSFCQKCRWLLHLNTHAPYLWDFEWSDTVNLHGCMVCTELALRRQQFHVTPAMQQPNSAVSTPDKKCTIKSKCHSFRITCDMITLSAWEQRIVL